MDKCKVCDKYQNVCSGIEHDKDRLVPDAAEMEKVYEKIEDKLHGKPYLADMFQSRLYDDRFAGESAVFISPHGHIADITHFFDLINLGGALNEIPNFVVAIRLKYYIRSQHVNNIHSTRISMKHETCFKLEGDFMTKITECFNEHLKDLITVLHLYVLLQIVCG